MQLPLYQIDAFTDTVFGGNPACVVPLAQWLPNEQLLQIAQENAVAETAFFIDRGGHIDLRWFTPEIEMDLCGHATLATAHCLHTLLQYNRETITFNTMSGILTVTVRDGRYWLDFPLRKPEPAALPPELAAALSIQPAEVLKARDYVLVYPAEADIRNLKINRQLFDQLNTDPGGVVVTAKGTDSDFVSRFFTPQASILEDPVTGSAHCSLIPLWAERLGKTDLLAYQLSARGGKLYCHQLHDRVLIGGDAKTYSVGTLFIE